MFSKLGRFEIKDVIGRGAMGEVYLGLDPTLGREVAIKTILASGLPEDQARQRFDREAKAAAVLNHPNIVTIHELGEDQGVLFIAMERLKGQDFEQILLQRSLTMTECLEVLAQVCDGLDAAHRHQIIHRDIKPSNIMVMRDGRKLLVKIMDFGVARLKDSAMTVVGTVMGTVNYIAPEYIRSGEPDARSDLFAVGVMLYECLSGRKPFEGDSASTVLFKIVNDPPKPIDISQLQGISPAVRGMLDIALAKEPDDRYQTAEEFALALRAAKDPGWQGKIEDSTVRMAIRPRAGAEPPPPLDSLIGQTVASALPAPVPGLTKVDPAPRLEPAAANPTFILPPVVDAGAISTPEPHSVGTEITPISNATSPVEAKPAAVVPEIAEPASSAKEITQEVDVTSFHVPPTRAAKTEITVLRKPPVPAEAKPATVVPEVGGAPFQTPSTPAAKTEGMTLPAPTPAGTKTSASGKPGSPGTGIQAIPQDAGPLPVDPGKVGEMTKTPRASDVSPMGAFSSGVQARPPQPESVTLPEAAQKIPIGAHPAPPSTRRGVYLVAGILVLMAAIIGGFFFLKSRSDASMNDPSATEVPAAVAPTAPPAPPPAPPPVSTELAGPPPPVPEANPASKPKTRVVKSAPPKTVPAAPPAVTQEVKPEEIAPPPPPPPPPVQEPIQPPKKAVRPVQERDRK